MYLLFLVVFLIFFIKAVSMSHSKYFHSCSLRRVSRAPPFIKDYNSYSPTKSRVTRPSIKSCAFHPHIKICVSYPIIKGCCFCALLKPTAVVPAGFGAEQEVRLSQRDVPRRGRAPGPGEPGARAGRLPWPRRPHPPPPLHAPAAAPPCRGAQRRTLSPGELN